MTDFWQMMLQKCNSDDVSGSLIGLIGPQVCPALRGLWDWWWWRWWHHARLSSSWHLLSPGMFWARRRLFYDVPHSWREEQGHLLQSSWLSCYRNHRRRLSEHRIWCGVLRLCALKHSQFFCLHAIHLKQLFSWNTFVQFWFPTENQGRSHMTISLRYKRACFQPLNQQNYDLCVLVTLCWSTVPYSSRKVHDNESSYRTTQTQAVINSPIITPCRISWKYMIITIDPKTTRFMSSQPIIMAK